MDRSTRRDMGVASAIGGALVVATLAVGHVFGPGGGEAMGGGVGGGDGAAIRLAGDRARSRSAPSLDGLRARSGPTAPAGDPGGTASSAGATDRPGRSGREGAGGGRSDDFRGDGERSGAAVPAPGAPSGGGSTDPSTPAPGGVDPTVPSVPADPGDVGDDGRLITAAVRLRVTDLSVTGTDSGTLRSGSEVRVRMSTERETITSSAATPRAATPRAVAKQSSTAASTSATATAAEAGDTARAAADPGGTAPLPDRLDVRIRLDDESIAALAATVKGSTGPKALRALVDLVGPRDGSAGAFSVRVRMQLTPAEKTRAVVTDGDRTVDGASNVVSVTAPIGPTAPEGDGAGAPGTGAPDTGTPGSDGGPVPGDGPTTPGDPGDASTTPGDGGSTGPGAPTTGDPTVPGTAEPTAEVPADPVEVLVALPTGDASTTPDDGASVGLPIPADPSTPTDPDAPTTADAAVVVHLPAADEPIGGLPEDLAVVPPPVADPVPADPDASGSDATPPSDTTSPSDTTPDGATTPSDTTPPSDMTRPSDATTPSDTTPPSDTTTPSDATRPDDATPSTADAPAPDAP
ncbi:hypothetical protein [Patulibacter sp.]|uniref:hypothetical protein n=1 Tax=Patulibacter sp. TaxID=1912859 RepID=UPI0027215D16|nr:hypothetical protein [Patulibacter sp.]MDO9409832.1 hypothetical protein [Patulibacter sp.]